MKSYLKTKKQQEIIVASLAGSVDGNTRYLDRVNDDVWSLPSREAWIEIPDGNYTEEGGESLPSREAWIEISTGKYC